MPLWRWRHYVAICRNAVLLLGVTWNDMFANAPRFLEMSRRRTPMSGARLVHQALLAAARIAATKFAL